MISWTAAWRSWKVGSESSGGFTGWIMSQQYLTSILWTERGGVQTFAMPRRRTGSSVAC